jgi:hypothetical protein
MYNLDIVGLACFSKQDGRGRIVLLPDGRDPDTGIDRHVPQLVVKTEEVEFVDARLPLRIEEGGVIIDLPESDLEFEGADTADPKDTDLDDTRHDPFLQRLSNLDKDFDGAAQDRAVVRFRIRKGQLLAYRFPTEDPENPDPAIVSRLAVPHDGRITIKVKVKEYREPLEVRLKPQSEIVLANTAPRNDELNTVSHFRIYEKLSKKPVNFSNRPPVGTTNLRDLPTANPFFNLASGSGDHGDCGNTGCCP